MKEKSNLEGGWKQEKKGGRARRREGGGKKGERQRREREGRRNDFFFSALSASSSFALSQAPCRIEANEKITRLRGRSTFFLLAFCSNKAEETQKNPAMAEDTNF